MFRSSPLHQLSKLEVTINNVGGCGIVTLSLYIILSKTVTNIYLKQVLIQSNKKEMYYSEAKKVHNAFKSAITVAALLGHFHAKVTRGL